MAGSTCAKKSRIQAFGECRSPAQPMQQERQGEAKVGETTGP